MDKKYMETVNEVYKKTKKRSIYCVLFDREFIV